MDGDLEVSCDALFDLLQRLGGMTVGEALVVDDDMGGQQRQAGRDCRRVQVADILEVVELEDV